MWAEEAWAVLELAPCDDVKAVKRAYARKLKAIDPDKDIVIFERLRAALASAKADANWRSSPEYTEYQESETDEWDEDWDEDYDTEYYPGTHIGIGPLAITPHMAFQQNLEQMEVVRPDFSPFTDDECQIDTVPSPKNGRDIAAKLNFSAFGGDEDLADNGEHPQNPDQDIFRELASALSDTITVWNNEKALQSLLQQIFDDPRMQNVDFAAQSERWIAILLGQTRPKSDPLILMAYNHFAWEGRLDSLNNHDPEFFLAQIGYDLIAEQMLSDPSHEWHEAYMRLTMENPPPISLKDKLQLGKKMERLIASLNLHNPALLYDIDQEYLDRWRSVGFVDEKSDTQSTENISFFSLIWIVLTLLWIAIKIAISFSAD